MLGTDFLGLVPPARDRTGWLVAALRAAVADGRLPAGTRLPPTRTLAGDLGVARGVVVEAYRRLGDEGLVTARTGAGTVVAAVPRPATPTGAGAPPGAATSGWVGVGGAAVEIDLAPGVPDLAAFPRAAWLRAERAVLGTATAADLGYGDPRGNPRLRTELAGWLARMRGLRAAPDELVVVAGVAQALALLAQTLVARGSTAIAVEDPGSRGARAELEHWGLTTVPVPVDEHGLVVTGLSTVDAAVVTPAHQFPTGVVLAPDRRRALLDWGGLVVEDDYDAEHRYDRAPVPALQAAAPDRVAHTGSTSKSLAPGLRLGWLVPPPHLHADVVAARYASDLGSPALPQLVLAHLLATGEYDRHLRLVRTRQRRRRDAVLAALREHLPTARVAGVAAGLHLLVLLPAGTDDAAAAARIRAAGVGVQPLSVHRVAPGPPGLVLGYAAHPPDRLREAVRRIAAAVDPAPPRSSS
jgi:GntR family transcriptional regulator/MocR family aminotransferase